MLLYLCDSHGESADPPKRWGNASSTWEVTIIGRRKKDGGSPGLGRREGRLKGRRQEEEEEEEVKSWGSW